MMDNLKDLDTEIHADAADPKRRTLLKTGLLSMAAAGLPPWLMPALAQDEVLVPFADVPDSFEPGPPQPGSNHIIDISRITTFRPPTEQFFIVQHYGQPEIDNNEYRLSITGLVNNKLEFSLAELQQRPMIEQDIGFECGGNGDRMFHGLVGNARWRGVRLRDLLEQAGIQPEGKEVIFFGADRGTEEIRGRSVEQSFARSLSVEDAMNAENMLAFEMNGEPLNLAHGKPVRLLVPGWYGVANVKWLTQIHVQDKRYMGRFMGRDYVTLKRAQVGNQQRWVENAVAEMNLKSIIARVTRTGDDYRIGGFVLNDGTDIANVEVQINDGPWQRADLRPESSQYSWKLFTYDWGQVEPGEHVIRSRVTDVDGNVQPPAEDLPEKVSYWEEFAQFPRRIRVG